LSVSKPRLDGLDDLGGHYAPVMPAGRRVPVVDARTIGRATLQRQLLLRRQVLTATHAVGRLISLNAQDPEPPYLALWNRLEGFAIPELTQALVDGEVVRSTMMRATQHMVTAYDFRQVRPLLAPLLRRVQRNGFGRALAASRPGSDAAALGASVQ
jgi:hypothetical protein